MIVVMGSKGGVGSTTVAAGLIAASASSMRVIPVDVGVSNDLIALGQGWDVHLLDYMARLPDNRLDAAIAPALAGRRRAAFALSGQGRVLYVKQAAQILDLLESHGVLVADMGVQPIPAILDMATHVVLVMTPDPRSLRRAEQFAQSNSRLGVIPVLNGAQPGRHAAAFDELSVLPDTGRADPLRDEAWTRAIGSLAGQLGLVAEDRGRPAHQRARSQRSLDWRGLIPRVRVVE